MSTIKLGNNIIGTDKENVYIIAEIGQNHQGSIDIAKKMILEAVKAGSSCVKFQKSDLSAKFSRSALSRKYENKNSWGTTYGEHKQFLEFSKEEYRNLKMFCNENQIDFTASAMDDVSLEFLNELSVPFIKIGSGDVNNFPLLEKAAKLDVPLVISTGMVHSFDLIDRIVTMMRYTGKENYALLHCVSAYPTKPSDCGLQFIPLLKTRYPEVVIGYSGHEIGIEISKAAVLCGARIIERHFTLNKAQKGSDHQCSLEPKELKKLVLGIQEFKHKGLLANSGYSPKEILNILGNTSDLRQALKNVTRKCILPCELNCKSKLGKSLVAAKSLKSGDILGKSDLVIKVSEPNGIPAEQYYECIGLKLLSNVEKDEPILKTNLLRT